MRRARPIWAAALAAAALAAPGTASAADIDVTTTADEYADPGPDLGCSLREAVRAAGDDAAFGGCSAGAGADSILLVTGMTYALTRAAAPEDANAFGDLDLDTADGVTIARDGAGARPAIDANDLDLPFSLHDRAIDLTGAGAFTLQGVRIADGDANLGDGGAIRWDEPGQPGDLTVSDSDLAGNHAYYGAAIHAETTGTHLIEDSAVHGGSATDRGAVFSAGELTLLRSSIAQNTAGGGVYAADAGPGSLRVERSTIADNAAGVAEAIGAVHSAGGVQVVNSTISGNTGGFVGAIQAHGDVDLSFTTIAENVGITNTVLSAGAIDTISADSVSLDATLLYANRVGFSPLNCNEPVDATTRPSLEDGSTCGLPGAPADPQLAPLADNGGATRTRGLYPGSPALDAVDGCGLGAIDQRGVPRPSDGCDIGAFEGTVPRPPDPPASDPAPPATTAKAGCKKPRRLIKGKCRKVKRKRKRVRARALAAEPSVIGRSVRGRPIRAVRVGDPASERVALVVGVIHGDERAGLGITRALRRMGPRIDAEVWVIDSLNPDGARSRSRRNARGVDLNRNFPHRWRGGVPRSSGYYPGPRAASEPETRAAMKLAKRIEPDLSIWYHQPWGAVLACRGRPRVAARYATLVGMATSCRGRGLPGTAIGWERARIPGAQAFVVELPAGGISGAAERRHANAVATLAEGE